MEDWAGSRYHVSETKRGTLFPERFRAFTNEVEMQLPN